MISQAALAALKKRHPCDAVVDDWGVALRKRGKKFIGPCPLHSPDLRAADSTSFECDADHWVCASCHDGGDVIRLVMLRERVTFVRAIEILGGAVEPDVERAADLDRVQAGRRREQYANAFRERARRAA
jgi:DNA primase